MPRFVTWNVNSIKARLTNVTDWVRATKPDVVMLQEIKCTDAEFPRGPFEDLGYNVAHHGQKGFNGVALCSKLPLEDVTFALPGDDSDTQARFVEAVVSVGGGAVRVASLYLPNGNPIGSEKFAYKLSWMGRLEAWIEARLEGEEAFLLGGDYNVIPEPRDARFPDNWTADALYRPESRSGWRRLVNLGLTDALRAASAAGGHYTFWDYQAGAWQKNNGIRIDHFLLSPQAADRLLSVAVDKRVRDWDKPSDHVPVIVEIAA